MPNPTIPRGTLIALGGGNDDPLLDLVSQLVPTPDTPVEVITTAVPRYPVKTGKAYVQALNEMGCTNVRHLRIDAKHPASNPATLRRLEQAGAVFFTGGDQENITDYWLDTPAVELLCERYHHDPNFIVSGTSAGASVMPAHMIVSGYGYRSLTKGGIEMARGLGLISYVYIDQHFVERGRFNRLSHAVLKHPTTLGIGLAEQTGIIIRHGREMEVFGDGVVTIVDGNEMRHDNLGRVGRGEAVGGQNLRVHLLVAGQRLDLRTRRILELAPAEGEAS
ncbi:cyanophycinase [Hymenobacter latericus]|uniref:cyanophycinase n=1 Tax=Hymenobacter sp. YIM 151858-1 TaxID=2987688 RepID=UPI0022271416|nr:cyanophycinase [Hymenobacter sp. YIM 151858-1]UYZ58592.1 cyanophycinase [Hymenobacter sp. YIM 151858-1]